MPPDPARFRSYVDESALGLGKALTIARHDVIHVGHPLVPELPLGVLDPVWIPAVATRDLIVIARDRKLRTKPAELALLRAHGLRVFWIAGKHDLSTWDYLARVVRHWDELEHVIADRPTGPWFIAINDGGLREIKV